MHTTLRQGPPAAPLAQGSFRRKPAHAQLPSTRHSLRRIEVLSNARATSEATPASLAPNAPDGCERAFSQPGWQESMQGYPSTQSSGAGSIVIQGSTPEACWRIRPYRADDREAVMRLQTDSFFQPKGIAFIDRFAYKLFEAEVRDALLQKIKYNSPNAFVILVAERLSANSPPVIQPSASAAASASSRPHSSGPASGSSASGSGSASATSGVGEVVGVVEVSLGSQSEVARELRRHALLGSNTPNTNGWRQPQIANGGGSNSYGSTSTSTSSSGSSLLTASGGPATAAAAASPAPSSSLPSASPASQPSSSYPSASTFAYSFQDPGDPDPEAVCYVSSMAVSTRERRKGLASGLLTAAEAQALAWRAQHLALYVYEDNAPAVKLYQKYGLNQASSSPSWLKALGNRVRLLMYKELSCSLAMAVRAQQEQQQLQG